MKKIYFIWILILLILGYGFSPVQIPKNWNDKIGENYIKGYYQQTTGGDFSIKKETVKSALVKREKPFQEINLTGNTPAKKYGFTNYYELMTSEFILSGEIIGTEKIKNVGEFYLFNVEKFYLSKYVFRFWSLPTIFMLAFGLSMLVFPILTMGIVLEKIRK